jgi:folate-binding protein YgfZ
MSPLPHHEFHAGLNAEFDELNGSEIVRQYADVTEEYAHLIETAGVIDLSFRGRICVLGNDRAQYLHGQLTNDINRLQSGDGCYSALCDAKGRIQSDLNIYALENEILLDFEPGLSELVTDRLNRNIVADDVELCDITADFGLLSVQGPQARAVIAELSLSMDLPDSPGAVGWIEDETLGQIYVANDARLGTAGFDLYAPQNSIPAIADKLITAARIHQGGPIGWNAFEIARIAAGIPRFGQDMTDANLVPEAGLGESAVSYRKGCYIGQEILNRLHTFAEVSKTLRRLEFGNSNDLPAIGSTIQHGDKTVGKLMSIAIPPDHPGAIALGYVHKSANDPGTLLQVGSHAVKVGELNV